MGQILSTGNGGPHFVGGSCVKVCTIYGKEIILKNCVLRVETNGIRAYGYTSENYERSSYMKRVGQDEVFYSPYTMFSLLVLDKMSPYEIKKARVLGGLKRKISGMLTRSLGV